MKKVLFVCIGNSCRSQMAEGFARTYGNGVLNVMSCGLAPATSVARMTREVMAERKIDVSDQFPKSFHEVPAESFDIIVNMSGSVLPVDLKARVLHWDIPDPILSGKEIYEEVASQIERMVIELIQEVRVEKEGD